MPGWRSHISGDFGSIGNASAKDHLSDFADFRQDEIKFDI
jgi:hypothetical protein